MIVNGKKCIITIVMLLCVIIMGNSFVSANQLHYHNHPFQLTKYDFSLIDVEQEFKNFSPEGWEKLIDLASQYEIKNDASLSVEPLQELKSKTIAEDSNLEEIDLKNPFFNFKPLPGVFVEANYNEEEEKYKIKINTNINLKYYMNEKTLITANYNLLNKELATDYNYDIDDEIITPPSEEELEVNDDNEFTEKKDPEGRLGVIYQTSDKMTISADYINKNIFSGTGGFATSLGVEYNDEIGQLRAKYHFDKDQEMKKTMTGLELDLNNLARFSASYKLYNPELVRTELNKESVWDIGFDVSLTDLSTLSFGYTLINNQELDQETASDFIEDKESNLEASFQIKF